MLPINVNMKKNMLRPPPELVTTACLSGGLSIIFSLISIVLCILAIVYRYECTELVSNGAHYFIGTLIKVYILDSECSHSLQREDLTKPDSVFILAIITLVFAVINLLSAVTMIIVVRNKEPVRYMDICIYLYIGVSLALFVVDLTLSVHFGKDHSTLKSALRLNSPGLAINYERDVIRLGALMLMSIALKGYIGHLVSIVLLILLASFVIRYQRMLHTNEHSIHKLGALNAFESPKRFEEPWSPHRNDMFMSYSRGPTLNNDDESNGPIRENPLTDMSQKRHEDPWPLHRNEIFTGFPRSAPMNPAFKNVDDPPRTPIKEHPMSDRSNRSNSWLHNSGTGMGSRPFSYLEEPKRPPPVKSPKTPTNEPNWRRDPWPPAPPVPDPDYSPPARRLKSALKSNYI